MGLNFDKRQSYSHLLTSADGLMPKPNVALKEPASQQQSTLISAVTYHDFCAVNMTQATARIKDTWSATEYNNTASFVYSDAFIQPVLDLLQPRVGERIADFGCGSGDVTNILTEAVGPSGVVLGLDSSESMVTMGLLT